MWKAIWGVLFIVGGFSGEWVLRGTDSSSALIVVGIGLVLWGGTNIYDNLNSGMDGFEYDFVNRHEGEPIVGHKQTESVPLALLGTSSGFNEINFSINPVSEMAQTLSKDIVSQAVEARKSNIMMRFAEKNTTGQDYSIFVEFLLYYMYYVDRVAFSLLNFKDKGKFMQTIWEKVIDEISNSSIMPINRTEVSTDLNKRFEEIKSYYDSYSNSDLADGLGKRISENITYFIEIKAVSKIASESLESLQITNRLLKLAKVLD